MRDKKHIDRLFQEGLKDFEATPSDAVWKNIEAELNKDKKKRRVIPIWWRYAGVAALLLVFLTLGINTFYNTSENVEQPEVVDTNSTKSSETENESISGENHSNSNINSAISDNANQENDINQNSEKENINNINQNTNKNNQTPSTASVIANTKPVTHQNNNHGQSAQNPNKTSKTVASSSYKKKKRKTLYTDANNSVANQTSEENNTISTKENAIAGTETNDKGINTEEPNETIADNNTKEESLTIEEVLNKTDDIIDQESEINRWSLAANAAPVYFNTTGKGSSIDPQFNSNSKTGEVNMSYGVTASYALNKRLRVRSGINKVNLGYNTNDVVSYQSIATNSAASSLQNVNYNSNASTNNDFSNSPASTVQTSLISADNLSQKNAASLLKTSNTSINQSLGYIEVPLELQYAVLNNKFGVNVIGGFSSLFLNNNEVFSEAQDGNRTYLGEASNINKVSYSANFGLGLSYQVSKKIDLNLEPMLKYQINTFNNTSGDFQPFFVGVYTGLAIKF
ncbi:outer membrane beta-barrel protein [Algibacter sp. L1A34]|uniref:outer membrane beta-barrel protein n=1 Tax=Algibacter sp. L1A34 TaxID=2686365 RepID=UPI00131BF70B|nr:outer membrane beta-barrel protein [Algibacter sp. L1A34]